MINQMQAVITQLKRDEGLSLIMYDDTVGVKTIGYGHNLDTPISMDAAEGILIDDIEMAILELDRHKEEWRLWPRNVRLVVINMMFNLGWPRYSTFVRFWAALEQGQWAMASLEMIDSHWYLQTKDRAKRLVKLMHDAENPSPAVEQ